jgi:hypothetical protein
MGKVKPGVGNSTKRAATKALEAARDVVEAVGAHDRQITELQQFMGMFHSVVQDVVAGSEEIDVTLMALIGLLAKKFGITSEELNKERDHIRALKASQLAKKLAAESADETPLPDIAAMRANQAEPTIPSEEFPGATVWGG